LYYAIKDFFDSGSNGSMIKRSSLPKAFITKLLGDTKLVRTLAGHLKMHKVITMRDLRLLDFYKNRRINQQKVLVFDRDEIKYNINLKETWNCLISPSNFVHLEVWNSNKFNAMEDMFNIQVKDVLFGED
jgi:hypothetical protein